MEKGNKIISFTNYRNNKKTIQRRYKLVHELTFELLKENTQFSCLIYPTQLLEEQFIEILNKIYLKLIKNSDICVKENDRMEINEKSILITLLYFENINNSKDFKFICSNPSGIDYKKLAVILNIVLL